MIRETNPLPSICGTICAHPCEEKCRRLTIDESLSIRVLKRYVIENAPNAYAPKKIAPTKGKKVAVIGSGPAGLTAAHDLDLIGYGVTVFERAEDFGGAVRWGVPHIDCRPEPRWLDHFILGLEIDILGHPSATRRCSSHRSFDVASGKETEKSS